MEIEIEGVKYRLRPSHKESNARRAGIAAIAAAMASVGIYGKPQHKDMPDYNLFDEVRLIKQKKSKLTRSEREHVMKEFNKHFEETAGEEPQQPETEDEALMRKYYEDTGINWEDDYGIYGPDNRP